METCSRGSLGGNANSHREDTMSRTYADDAHALPETGHDPQDAEAVRDTLAEWLEKQSRRVASGAYLADLEDGTSGRDPVLDVCFLALQGAGMAYTVAEAHRDEDRMDAASKLEEELGSAVRAVLPPELHEDVVNDATEAVGDRLAELAAEPEGGAS